MLSAGELKSLNAVDSDGCGHGHMNVQHVCTQRQIKATLRSDGCDLVIRCVQSELGMQDIRTINGSQRQRRGCRSVMSGLKTARIQIDALRCGID